jgi:hypothetical protein
LLAPMVRLEHAVDRFVSTFGLPAKAKSALRAEIEGRFGAGAWASLAVDGMARGLTTPALIVHDGEDSQIDLQDAVLLSESWRGARMMTTSGLAHDRILRDENVIAEVTNFLVENGAPDLRVN